MQLVTLFTWSFEVADEFAVESEGLLVVRFWLLVSDDPSSLF